MLWKLGIAHPYCAWHLVSAKQMLAFTEINSHVLRSAAGRLVLPVLPEAASSLLMARWSMEDKSLLFLFSPCLQNPGTARHCPLGELIARIWYLRE